LDGEGGLGVAGGLSSHKSTRNFKAQQQGRMRQSCVSKWQVGKHVYKQGGEVSKSVNKSATFCVNIKYVTVQ